MAEHLEPLKAPRTDLSLSKAAKTLGVSKSVISRAIESGKLSARRDADGPYQIDPAELTRFRDHVLVTRSRTGGENSEQPGFEPAGDGVPDRSSEWFKQTPAGLLLQKDLEHLKDRVSYLEQDRERLVQESSDWKHQAQKLQEQASAATRLLADQSQSGAKTSHGGVRLWVFLLVLIAALGAYFAPELIELVTAT